MCIKKMWTILFAAAMVVGQCSLCNLVSAESDYNCSDLEVYFVEGYGWSPGLPSSDDSLAFANGLEKLLWKDGEPLLKYGMYATTAIVDFVERPGFIEAASAKLLPSETNELRKNVVEGGKSVARQVNYHENVGRCPNTKYVLAGFGTGAAKAREALQYINPDKVLYAALFSDPTLYLPEGKGLLPDACLGRNLSDYRMYAPNCRTSEGVLGGTNPYVPSGYEGKVGTWCNDNDMFCGAGYTMTGHARYKEDGIYEDAAKVIYDKVRVEFGLEKNYSKHDTAIIIDSTGSMGRLIGHFKSEALNLAEKTLANGGRVALYDYRDYSDGYPPVQHCNFETCTLEEVRKGLDEIVVGGGGDRPESLLWSARLAMTELKWEFGATKSLVVLTDADFHNPDLDGTKMEDVVKLSKEIDPVNFYVVTTPEEMEGYEEITAATGGRVASSTGDLSELTEIIMERYDSLPRVVEGDADVISDEELMKMLMSEIESNAEKLDDVVIPKTPNTGKLR